MSSHGQEKVRRDGTALICMSTDVSDGLKFAVYPQEISISDIHNLMENGRYIVSLVTTKFATLVVHKSNTKSVEQCIALIPSYNLEKEAKSMFKQKYILKYYNKQREYAIFEKNTDIKRQLFIKNLYKRKKIIELQKKGLYATLVSFGEAVAQDVNSAVSEQLFCSYNEKSHNVLDSVKRKIEEGWMVSSVAKFYNDYGDYTHFNFMFDRVGTEGSPYSQAIFLVETPEEMVSALTDGKASGYNISMTWGGWEDRDYEAERARANEYNPNIFEILTGLTNSISGIINYSNTSNNINTDYDVNTNTGTARQNARPKQNRCILCHGSGKCEPKTASGRKNACYGSGLCGYCSGTGWIKAGSGEAKCTACNGTGKCKKCHGTGKCSLCHGTGH